MTDLSSKLKIFLGVFVYSFALNLIWENLHSFLYSNYRGGTITEFILLRATLSDAIYITVAGILVLFFTNRRIGIWLTVFLLLLASIFIEKYALLTGRWAYNSIMPIIPLLKTGLTPTIQLALLGYLAFRFVGLTVYGTKDSISAESRANLK